MPESDQPNEFNSFEVEITDLDVPQRAKSRVRARLDHLLLRWQRSEHRRTRLWLSGILLVSLACTLIVALLSPVAGVTALLTAHWPFLSTSMPLVAQGALPDPAFFHDPNQIRCPVQSAWSPNSSLIALLGYTQPCAQGSYVPAQIDLYNAATTRRIAHWQPDAAIFTALQKAPDVSLQIRALASRKPTPGMSQAAGGMPVIQYLQMLWSPDNMRVAIRFGVVNRFMAYDGLFLADAYGHQAQVLLQPGGAQDGLSQVGPLEWDVQNNIIVPIPALTPALTYAWDAHDTLVPLTPLNAQTNLSRYSTLPPGNPAGERTFSIWQPGRPLVLSPVHASGAYLWSSSFATWSPDGHYLVTDITFTGLMEPPGQAFPTPAALNSLDVQSVPRVPDHDPALIPAAANAQAMAWNPTGTVLAVYDRAGIINLYDCRSGKLLRLLKPAQAQPLTGTAILLSWSPDGRSLLLSSAQWGLITLWDVGTLHVE